MCIIVHNREGSRKLTREEFDQCWNRNPHGFGCMYVKDGVVNTMKSLDLEQSFELYNTAMGLAQVGGVVSHFRFGTQGLNDLSNVHPFHCGTDEDGGKIYMVHNGVLPYRSKMYPGWSDTRIFAKLLEGLPKGFHMKQEYRTDILKKMSWDKIVMMDSEGNVQYFYNTGHEGVVLDIGIWCSNGGAKIYNPSPVDIIKQYEEGKRKKKSYTVNGVTYIVGNFFKIPAIADEEIEGAYFVNGNLYFQEFYIDKYGIVCELTD